jgi:hypothetical protein
MTQLKDVLHLYLGSPCHVGDSEDIEYIRIVSEGSFCANTRTLSDGRQMPLWFKNSHCKPILRPLSSMTEAEVKHIGCITMPDVEPSQSDIDCVIDGVVKDGLNAFDFSDLEPLKIFELTAYLLKQSFDLFGLIESGQAIDATKQKSSI